MPEVADGAIIQRFLVAIKNDELNDLSFLLVENPNYLNRFPNDPKGRTCLQAAVFYGSIVSLELLLGYPGIQLTEESFSILLKMASDHINNMDHRKKVIHLLEGAKDFLFMSSYIAEWNTDAIKKMLQKNPEKINMPLDEKGNTALHKIARSNDLYLLIFFLSYKRINVDQRNHKGKTPLDVFPGVIIEYSPGKRVENAATYLQMFAENKDIFSILFYFKIQEMINNLENELSARFFANGYRKRAKKIFLQNLLKGYDQRIDKKQTLPNLIYRTLCNLAEFKQGEIDISGLSYGLLFQEGFSNRTKKVIDSAILLSSENFLNQMESFEELIAILPTFKQEFNAKEDVSILSLLAFLVGDGSISQESLDPYFLIKARIKASGLWGQFFESAKLDFSSGNIASPIR